MILGWESFFNYVTAFELSPKVIQIKERKVLRRLAKICIKVSYMNFSRDFMSKLPPAKVNFPMKLFQLMF